MIGSTRGASHAHLVPPTVADLTMTVERYLTVFDASLQRRALVR